MQRIRFQPVSNLIVIPLKVMGIDGKSFRDVEVALDTGASTMGATPLEVKYLLTKVRSFLNGITS